MIEPLDDVKVDEDASQGNAGGDTAPWLGVNASVGADKDLVILAIYYQTSDQGTPDRRRGVLRRWTWRDNDVMRWALHA